MSLINRTIIFFFSIFIIALTSVSAEELKKIGKFKDWETLILNKDNELVCFAQTKPVLQSPKSSNLREARLFVSFRPNDKITDEISTTSGYEFNSQNSILATSGKRKYKFDITQDGFAWITNNKVEKKMIKTMKKGSRIMVTAYNKSDNKRGEYIQIML